MTDELIEIAARALCKADWGHDRMDEFSNCDAMFYPERAKAALQAIQSSGTFMVVPVEPSEDMIDAYFDKMHELGFHGGMNATAAYTTMLAACK